MCKLCKKLKEINELKEKDYKQILTSWKNRDVASTKLLEQVHDVLNGLQTLTIGVKFCGKDVCEMVGNNDDVEKLLKKIEKHLGCSWVGK